MKNSNNLVIVASIILSILNGCKTTLEEKETLMLQPLDILKSFVDTNFLYEEPWDYATRIGKEPIYDSANSVIFYKNRLQIYKGIEILQLHRLEKTIEPRRIAYLDSILKKEGLRFNDSVLIFIKYDLTKHTKNYFFSMTDSLYEINHASPDSAIFCVYNFSHIIKSESNRAYFFYEFMKGPKHAAGYIVILKKDENSNNWQVEKRLQIWIS